MKRSSYCTILLLCFVALSVPVLTRGQDTASVHQLPTVNVGASRPSAATAQVPTYIVTATELAQQGALLVSDAVRHVPGVTLKDYGGIGGIKTISARGLGSQFSILTIDGVVVNDCQNGQVDLSRYLIGNADYISFANGQHDALLQSARSLSAGNVLNLQSHQPMFHGRAYNLSAQLETGSFGLVAPTLSYEQRLGDHLSLSLWGNYLYSQGDYPFTLYYTTTRTDSSSVERRSNTQVRQGTVDATLFWVPNHRQRLTVKVHHADAHHALPGPVTYYAIKGSEFTQSHVNFVQSVYHHILSDKARLQAVAKYSHIADSYKDTASRTAGGYLYNHYLQQEAYASATLNYQLTPRWQTSLATDQSYTTLHSNLAHNSLCQRLSSQNVMTIAYHRRRIDVSANALLTLIKEHTNEDIHHIYHKLSPYLGCSVLLYALFTDDTTDYHTLHLRCFTKENYRVPTFNEMYYFTLPRSLNPERALQCNLGLAANGEIHHTHVITTTHYLLSLDAYYNHVTDKIIAIPTQNLFLWSMTNLGIVHITGLDVKGTLSFATHHSTLHLSANYTFQQALDMTDPHDKSYRNQIAYIPRNSGGLTLYWDNPYVNLGYDMQCVGRRYRLGQNTPNNLVDGYIDQSISLSHTFQSPHCQWQLTLRVLNLFDVQYEVVKNYPMMGRNYRLSLNVKI